MAIDREQIPNLIVPGGQKCGSSALAHFLSLHPDCFLSNPKEPSFFSRARNLADLAAYNRHFHGSERAKVLFEASTGYLFESYVPERIRSTLLPIRPDLKCVIILRRPVDRVISSYLHLKKRFDDHRSAIEVFEEMPREVDETFVAEERRIKHALAQNLIDVDRYRDRYDDPMWQFRYIRNSWYPTFVRAYMEAVGGDRVRVIFAEDLRAQPRETISEVFDFLGLPPFRHASFVNKVNPTLLPRGMDIFQRTKRGPTSRLLKRYSNRVLPYIGAAYAPSANKSALLSCLKSALDCVLSEQYSELSSLTNRDVAKIWPRVSCVETDQIGT